MFTMVDIITDKKEGRHLSDEKIRFFIDGYVNGEISDYQVSALLMAIYFRGMDENEIFTLTEAMKNSGEKVSLDDIEGVKVDKHSSGGVGDKLSLTACPIAAAAGVKIAKMSGRGLGFTGGTIDKLEAIPGFRTDISMKEFKDIVRNIGISIMSQSEEIAKADKLMYALRDVTSTVDIPALIASSIMSKKLAMGSDAVILDVKYGDGALMKTKEEAEHLARLMVKIGEKSGKKTTAVISDMQQPLGNMIGNSLEIIEAINTLKGTGHKDLTESTVNMAGKMIYLGGKAESEEEGIKTAQALIENGNGITKFKEFVKAQGGNDNIVENFELLPKASLNKTILGKDIGVKDRAVISSVSAMNIGMASQAAGAGRISKSDKIDYGAGICLIKKSGDIVEADDEVATVYSSDKEKLDWAFDMCISAYNISID